MKDLYRILEENYDREKRREKRKEEEKFKRGKGKIEWKKAEKEEEREPVFVSGRSFLSILSYVGYFNALGKISDENAKELGEAVEDFIWIWDSTGTGYGHYEYRSKKDLKRVRGRVKSALEKIFEEMYGKKDLASTVTYLLFAPEGYELGTWTPNTLDRLFREVLMKKGEGVEKKMEKHRRIMNYLGFTPSNEKGRFSYLKSLSWISAGWLLGILANLPPLYTSLALYFSYAIAKGFIFALDDSPLIDLRRRTKRKVFGIAGSKKFNVLGEEIRVKIKDESTAHYTYIIDGRERKWEEISIPYYLLFMSEEAQKAVVAHEAMHKKTAMKAIEHKKALEPEIFNFLEDIFVNFSIMDEYRRGLGEFYREVLFWKLGMNRMIDLVGKGTPYEDREALFFYLLHYIFSGGKKIDSEGKIKEKIEMMENNRYPVSFRFMKDEFAVMFRKVYEGYWGNEYYRRGRDLVSLIRRYFGFFPSISLLMDLEEKWFEEYERMEEERVKRREKEVRKILIEIKKMLEEKTPASYGCSVNVKEYIKSLSRFGSRGVFSRPAEKYADINVNAIKIVADYSYSALKSSRIWEIGVSAAALFYAAKKANIKPVIVYHWDNEVRTFDSPIKVIEPSKPGSPEGRAILELKPRYGDLIVVMGDGEPTDKEMVKALSEIRERGAHLLYLQFGEKYTDFTKLLKGYGFTVVLVRNSEALQEKILEGLNEIYRKIV